MNCQILTYTLIESLIIEVTGNVYNKVHSMLIQFNFELYFIWFYTVPLTKYNRFDITLTNVNTIVLMTVYRTESSFIDYRTQN